MSLNKVYGRSKDRYLELIHRFPLRPIKDDAEHDDAILVIDALIDETRLNRAEQDYLEAISVFVEAYEEKEHPIDVPVNAHKGRETFWSCLGLLHHHHLLAKMMGLPFVVPDTQALTMRRPYRRVLSGQHLERFVDRSKHVVPLESLR